MFDSRTITLTRSSGRGAVAVLAATVLSLFAFAPAVSGNAVISESGEGAAQTSGPDGLAVDYETGRLYVADRDNSRVDVFGPSGVFEKAFGWGVQDGKSKLQACTTVTTCRKGLPGEGNGQFSGLTATEHGGPTAIAVDNSCFLHKPEPLIGAVCEVFDPSDGDVYVVDPGSQRVEKFDGEGNFILTFGGGVDKTVPGNVCTEESKHTCGVGSNGFGEGELSSSYRIFVGVGPGGVVYILDNHLVGVAEKKYRLQRFEPSGAEIVPQRILLPEGASAGAFAVDSTGDFYVGSEAGGPEAIRKYEPGGGLIGTVAQENLDALAVDSADNLFLATLTEDGKETGGRLSFVEYDSGGSSLRRFGYGSLEDLNAGGLAPYHSATGDVYVSEPEEFGTKGNRVLHIDFPGAGPLVRPEPCKPSFLGNTKATLSAEVNPEGKATTFHFQYITDADFVANGSSFNGAHPASSTTESASVGSDFIMHKVSGGVSVVPETKYHCRMVATNGDAPADIEGKEGTFTSQPPLQIGATWASEVGTKAATLNAEVNPFGIATTGYFEYVEEVTYQKDVAELGPNHGFDHAIKIPGIDESINFGSGESFKASAVAVSGLAPGIVYRYRLVAADEYFAAGLPGHTEAFRTYHLGEGALPDGRAWELVSPDQKNSAEVGVGPPDGGATSYETYRLIQAGASSGEAITYTSWSSFADPEGAPGTSQYLSKRTGGGWRTENISPSPPGPKNLIPPYRGFSADLGFGALVTGQPIAGGEVLDNLYLRDDRTGALTTLTVGEPNIETSEVCLDYAGSSEDGSRAFFAANASYAGAPKGKGNGKDFSLYEWSMANGLVPLSVLPGKSTAVVPSPKTAFGAIGAGGGHCQTGETVLRHAVSADGRTAFWTYSPGTEKEELEHTSPPTRLMARIGGEETIQLDAKAGGVGPAGNGVFRAASPDGSKAVFTAPGRLTKDAGAEGQLYHYDTVERLLTDLTPGATAPEIEGVAGTSEDDSYVYFVAKGALTDTEENATGEKAVKGANNLYVYHEGDGLRFIAALSTSEVDEGVWSSNPRYLNARVSPDGRHLAFLSVEAEVLSGYDNTIATGVHCQPPTIKGEPLTGSPLCPEAFVYDADANTLTCASCNPSGARPTGPTTLPGWTNSFEGPRYLSGDGSRLFFESLDSLSASDENGKRDVYEFERAGNGNCDVESTAFDAISGSCHFLISSGKSTDESYLLDASSDGRDVFVSTRSPLTGWDTNENYDVYDAREGGGFPEPSEQSACLGEGCKPPLSLASSPFSSATAAFSGAGNLALEVIRPAVKAKPKSLTDAQRLARALKRCKKDKSKKKRAVCEKNARKKYGRRK